MGYLSSALNKLGVTSPPGPKITAHDRAVLDLKLQRDKMKQYQKRVVLDREQEIAKEALAAGNKKRALTALRQRKYQESLLVKTDAQLQNLQDLVSTIEFTQIQATVIHGLQMGNEVLKQLHKEVSLEKVEKLMDQTREGVEYQREIDEALVSQMSPEEEEAVQAELERLQSEAIPSVPIQEPPMALPNAPTEEPVEVVPETEPQQPQRAEVKEQRVALEA